MEVIEAQSARSWSLTMNLHNKQVRSTPVRPPASVYKQHEVWPRADGCVRTRTACPLSRTDCGTREGTVPGWRAAGVRSGHAEQVVAGGAPSGFSRIQIAW